MKILKILILSIFLGVSLKADLSDLKNLKTPEQLSEKILKSRDEAEIICAYGMLLDRNPVMSSDLMKKTFTKIVKKKDLRSHIIALTSFYEADGLILNILDVENGELAAEVLATRAFHNILYENADIRFINLEGSDDKKRINTQKKLQRKRDKKVQPPTEFKLLIPQELFESRSEKTLYLSILAAAYSKQPVYAEKIGQIKDSGGKIMAAKALFSVMTGQEIKDSFVKQAFLKSRQTQKPLSGTPSSLSEVNMDIPAMATLVDALGRTKDPKYLGIIHLALKMKDERIRIEALRALRKIPYNKTSLPVVYGMLKDSEWTVLIEICNYLGEFPNKASIPHLINRFKNENGRFRLDVCYALSSIAGQNHGNKVEDWENWWKNAGNEFEVNGEKTLNYRQKVRVQDVGVKSRGMFYEIGIYSDRCSFVLDYSASMKGNRIESLQENMLQTLNGLSDYVQFNICDFGGVVNFLYEDALTDNKKRAEKYIMKAQLTWGTRTMDAIATTMLLPELDTIYFLSDGAPCLGRIEKWGMIHSLIRLMNRYRHIAISTICFDPSENDQAASETMADENYGHHESIDI